MESKSVLFVCCSALNLILGVVVGVRVQVSQKRSRAVRAAWWVCLLASEVQEVLQAEMIRPWWRESTSRPPSTDHRICALKCMNWSVNGEV